MAALCADPLSDRSNRVPAVPSLRIFQETMHLSRVLECAARHDERIAGGAENSHGVALLFDGGNA
jgi:hypothetical protein